jgi:hypothetical protein
MTDRAMKTSIEVLEDFTSFFECTPGFISMPCEKLRLKFGKANFTMKVVKNLMDLRVDLDKSDKAEALETCQEVL